MSRLSISTADGRRAFAAVETIDVVAEWQLDREPTAIEIRLVWYTRGKGDRDADVAETVDVGSRDRSGSRRVSLQLPEGPYSFSGRLISLLWSLELVAEPAGDADRIDITIAPDAREVLLGSAEGIEDEVPRERPCAQEDDRTEPDDGLDLYGTDTERFGV